MKKFVVSNRVFWAGIVLVSAALIGRNGGQAQPPKAPAQNDTEIVARTLTLVDGAGHQVITMGGGKDNTALLEIGAGGANGKIKIVSGPVHGATIMFNDKDKPTRLITAYASKDMSLSGPPGSK